MAVFLSYPCTTIHQRKSTNALFQTFSTSWEIQNLQSLAKKSITTPSFSPIPNSDFHIEFSYMVSESQDKYKEAACKLILFWNCCSFTVPDALKMDLTVTFETADGEVLRKCVKDRVNVFEKNSLVILNAVERLYDIKYHATYKLDYSLLTSNKPNLAHHSSLIMKFKSLFYEHLCTPTDYFRDKQTIKCLKDFVDDFDCISPPSLFDDVQFKFEDKLLPAQKSILAAHSPVFLKMLSSDFLESKTNIIPIADSTPEVFHFFLKFLYCGEMEDESLPVVKELFALADKYDVRALKRKCGDLLASFLSVENVCEILKLAYDFRDDYLKEEAKRFAAKNFNEISSEDEWEEFSKSSPFIAYEVVINLVPKVK